MDESRPSSSSGCSAGFAPVLEVAVRDILSEPWRLSWPPEHGYSSWDRQAGTIP